MSAILPVEQDSEPLKAGDWVEVLSGDADAALREHGLAIGGRYRVERSLSGMVWVTGDADHYSGWLRERFKRVSPPPPVILPAKKESDETRVVDPVTGGEKGSKLPRFDLLPAGPLWLLAEHYGRGARKYADRNWEKGYKWSLSFAALMRHAWAFWRGEDLDPETGSPHIVAVAWHALALAEFRASHPEMDDRPKAAP